MQRHDLFYCHMLYSGENEAICRLRETGDAIATILEYTVESLSKTASKNTWIKNKFDSGEQNLSWNVFAQHMKRNTTRRDVESVTNNTISSCEER